MRNDKNSIDNTEIAFSKVPPQALDAENAVLGGLMLESEAYDRVAGILHTPECFYRLESQIIYSAIQGLYRSGSKVDLLTITDALRKANELDKIGGAYHLSQLAMDVVSTAHIEAHAKIVFEKYALRRLISIGSELIKESFDGGSDFFEIIESSDRKIQSITEGLASGTLVDLGSAYIDMRIDIEERKESGKQLAGTDTGYPELNKMLSGKERGRLILIGARPSQGKTALMLNLAENAVTSELSPAGGAIIFSLETSVKPLVRRMAACKTNIPLQVLRNATWLSPEQETILDNHVSYFASLPIQIDATSQELNRIIGVIRKAHKEYLKTPKGKSIEHGGLGLPFEVYLDFVQLVKGDKRNGREQEIAGISRAFKLLAIELDIVIVLLVQLNREAEKRADKKPSTADLRESGALEQDADIIIMIWHQVVEGMDKNGQPNVDTHLLVTKNKDGETGSVKLKFAGDIQKWKAYEEFDETIQASGVTSNYQQPKQQKADDWDMFDNPSAGITKRINTDKEPWEY